MSALITRSLWRDCAIVFPMLGGLTVDPPASFRLFGLEIYLYGVLVALGFLAGGLWCAGTCRRFGPKKEDIWDGLLWLIPVSLAGARLLYVLLRLDYYLQYPGKILALRDGGLSVFGGILAGAGLAWLLARHKKIPLPALTDCAGAGLLLGLAVGRWGGFLNREAFGLETEIFCRMGLVTPGGTVFLHPIFLYESLWDLAGFLILTVFEHRGKRRFDGQCTLLCLLWYGLGRAWTGALQVDRFTEWTAGFPVYLVTVLLVLIPLNILLYLRRRTFGPEALWVNRSGAPAPAGEADAPGPAAPVEKAAEQADDEAVSLAPAEEKEDRESTEPAEPPEEPEQESPASPEKTEQESPAPPEEPEQECPAPPEKAAGEPAAPETDAGEGPDEPGPGASEEKPAVQAAP